MIIGVGSFFWGPSNKEDILFYQLKYKSKAFFYSEVDRKISNFKIQGKVHFPRPCSW